MGGWGGRKAPIGAAPPALHPGERKPFPFPPIIPLVQIQQQPKNLPLGILQKLQLRNTAQAQNHDDHQNTLWIEVRHSGPSRS